MNARPLVVSALVAALLLSPAPARAQFNPATDAWRFDNPGPDFDWDLFRESFIGVGPVRDPVAYPFDVLLYDQVYMGYLSGKGVCYGMSVLSLLLARQGGYLGVCSPASQYSGTSGPSSAQVARAINIVHAYQLNIPTLEAIVDTFAAGKNTDGAYAWSQMFAYQSMGEPTIVSITKTLNPADGGHTLIGYKATDEGGGVKRIWVWDPNRVYGRDGADGTAWYEEPGAANYITINSTGWSFEMVVPYGTWPAPGGVGNSIITPLSAAGARTRTPSSMGDAIVGRLITELILTGSDAEVEQVNDGLGKRLYRPGTREFDTDPATGMRNTAPLLARERAKPGQPPPRVLYVMGDHGGSLEVRVRAGSDGYTLHLAGGTSVATVRAKGGTGADVLQFTQPGTRVPTVTLRNERGASKVGVEITQVVRPRESVRALRALDLAVPAGTAVEVGLPSTDGGLQVRSEAPQLDVTLELATQERGKAEVTAKSNVRVVKGAGEVFAPKNWKDVRAAPIERKAVER